jgi:hypothetical protein
MLTMKYPSSLYLLGKFISNNYTLHALTKRAPDAHHRSCFSLSLNLQRRDTG